MLRHLPRLLPLSIALHNLSTRIWRTVLTLLGIILGVAVVLAIDITNQSTLASINETLERAVGKAELLIVPKGDDETIDEGLIQWVLDVEGVQLAAPDLSVYTFLANESPGTDARWSGQGVQLGRMFEFHGIDPEVDPQVRLYYLIDGRMPDEKKYEVIVSKKFADDKGIGIGDKVVFSTPNGQESLEVVGLLRDEGVAALNGGKVGFAGLEVIQDIFGLGDVVHEISIQVNPEIAKNPEKLAVLKEKLEKRLAENARTIYPSARGDLVPRMLNTYQIGLTFFSIISIFVGAFLIYNTFSMNIAERTKEIGMFRAIGMGRSQVMLMVMLEAGILGIFGAILGSIAGIWLARSLMAILGGFLTEATQLIAVSWESLIKSTGIGIGVTLFSALIPANQAANISPLEALRVRSRTTAPLRASVWFSGLALLFIGYAGLYLLDWRLEILVPAGSTAIFFLLLGAVLTLPLLVPLLERGSRWITIVLYGKEGVIGSANVRRSTFRTTLTVACLMIALVMIIGIGTVSDTFEADIQRWVNSALGGDVFVIAPSPMQLDFVTQLQSIPGIKVISPSRFFEVRVAPSSVANSKNQREKLIFTAIDPEPFRKIGDMVFITGKTNPDANWLAFEQDRAIFISSVVAEEYGLKIGDTLNLLTRRGERPFRVAAIITDFSSQGYVIIGTYQNLKRWFIEEGVDRFTITVSENVDPQEVAEEIETRFKVRHSLDIQTIETVKSSVTTMLHQAFQLFDVLSLIGVIIGTLGVINTLAMNILERTTEIGALRSIGMTKGQVIRMVLAESFAMGVMGCIFGIIFGYLISLSFIRALVVLSSYDVEYTFAQRPYLLSIIIALGVSQLAAMGPSWRAARTNIITAIKHE
jgi:putative ABC transport system permease protein